MIPLTNLEDLDAAIKKNESEISISAEFLRDVAWDQVVKKLKVYSNLIKLTLPADELFDIKSLASLLQDNYSILEVTGIDNKAIKEIVKRNNDFADTALTNFGTEEGADLEKIHENRGSITAILRKLDENSQQRKVEVIDILMIQLLNDYEKYLKDKEKLLPEYLLSQLIKLSTKSYLASMANFVSNIEETELSVKNYQDNTTVFRNEDYATEFDPSGTKAMVFDPVVKVKAIAKGIETNKNIKKLDLFKNGIENAGAIAFAKALEVNNTLEVLILDWNIISDTGMIVLALSLKTNETLNELSLVRNNVGDGGAANFAEALKTNETLQILKLGNNVIKLEGAKSLATMLAENKTLKKLDLNSNELGDAGAKALAEALTKNTSLEKLNLKYCDVNQEGADALLMSLGKNNSLEVLELGLIEGRYKEPIGLRGVLANNSSIKEISGVDLSKETQAILDENKNEKSEGFVDRLSKKPPAKITCLRA